MAQKRESNCQIEANIPFTKLISHPSVDGLFARSAPLRILSFDIECSGRKGVFPEPEHDPVIQIANYVTVQGEKRGRERGFLCGICL